MSELDDIATGLRFAQDWNRLLRERSHVVWEHRNGDPWSVVTAERRYRILPKEETIVQNERRDEEMLF